MTQTIITDVNLVKVWFLSVWMVEAFHEGSGVLLSSGVLSRLPQRPMSAELRRSGSACVPGEPSSLHVAPVPEPDGGSVAAAVRATPPHPGTDAGRQATVSAEGRARLFLRGFEHQCDACGAVRYTGETTAQASV